MGQSFFEFKQFRIEQGNCGMKVTTDACIQGAWTPAPVGKCNILDAGTGTGLLALMIAQRTASLATIDAIELDDAAFHQASENFAASPFHHRLNAHQHDLRNWRPSKQYHILICNPPFFSNSLPAKGHSRNVARHDETLNQRDILQLMQDTLLPDGIASILLPLAAWEVFNLLVAIQGWHPQKILKIKDKPDALVKRVVCIYAQRLSETTTTILNIKNGLGNYTPEFQLLLKPYYLHL